jgi:hypothetical protein
MELGSILLAKFFVLSAVWTFGWLFRFVHIGAEPTNKNMAILFCPWILTILYILLFWWG